MLLFTTLLFTIRYVTKKITQTEVLQWGRGGRL